MLPSPTEEIAAPTPLLTHGPPVIVLFATVIVVSSLVNSYTPSFNTLSSTYAVSFAASPKIGAVKESCVWLSGSMFSTFPAKLP